MKIFNKIFYNGWAVLAAFLFLQSCSNNPYADFSQTETGLYYRFITEHPADSTPQETDILNVHLRYGTADSIIYDSKLKGLHPMRMVLMPSNFQNDIYEGLKMMHAGDSAIFLIDADSFFLKTGNVRKLPDIFKSGDKIHFYVHLFDFQTEKQMEAEKALWIESLKNAEPELIQEYLDKNSITVDPTASGIYIVKSKKGEKKRLHVGDQVSLHLRIRTLNGSEIYSSRKKGDPWKIILGKRFDTPAATEIISNLSKGSVAHAVVPSSQAWGEEGRGTMIAPYTPLLYDVEIIDVVPSDELKAQQNKLKKQSDEEREEARLAEPALIADYISKNNIQVKPQENGLYYIEREKGTGPMAEKGRTLKVHYTGMLLDGTIFDSSLDRGTPYSFVLGGGRVIKGWDEGVANMRVGGKARLIIPSALAYGSTASGKIPAYSPLIFDVELVDME